MKHLSMTDNLYHYMLDISLREHPVLKALREKTSTMELANMQVAPEQAQFMQWLIRLTQSKKILELGTFTGYSALAMALALPEGGKLITCDINEEWTKHALPFWRDARQDHKIDLKIGPALQTLKALLAKDGQHQFDFIFIDADKTNYIPYYELSLQLVKPHGFIGIDNIFWDGNVINPEDVSAQTREIKKLNQLIKNDNRVHVSLLGIADGLFLIQPNKLD